MNCPNCGNNMGDNSNFCNNCGASAGPRSFAPIGMSEKEYFGSEYCSKTAKNYLTTTKILLGVIALCIAFTAFINIQGFTFITNLLDAEQDDIASIIEKLEELSGESLEIDMGDFKDYKELDNELKKELGYSLTDFIKISMYIAIGIVLVTSLLIILFAALAVFKFSKGFAITTLVLSLLLSGNWIVIGAAIALLVLTLNLLKEYKQYSENSCYGRTYGNNEPYFGA